MRVWWAGAALAAAAFGVLGALVVDNAQVHGLDQWSVDHLMPGLSRRAGALKFVGDTSVNVGGREHSLVRVAARVVTEPASAWPSVVLVVLLATVAWRRGSVRVAVVWLLAFGVAGATELLLKGDLTRPPLTFRTDVGTYPVAGFDSSYPSGHAVRALLLAAFAAAIWPAPKAALAGWVFVSGALLVLGGFHTPTDVVGGLLLGLAIVGFLKATGRKLV